MKLDCVCANIHNSHFTADAARSLVVSAGDPQELRNFVVDNQSAPEHVEKLRGLAAELPESVNLLLNDQNVACFPRLNCGIRRMRGRYLELQHLVIGNNDLLLSADFYATVEHNFSVLDAHAVVSPDIVTLDGEHQDPHVASSISKTRELVYGVHFSSCLMAQGIPWAARVARSVADSLDERQHRTAQPICEGHGACYLIGPMYFLHFREFCAPTLLIVEE